MVLTIIAPKTMACWQVCGYRTPDLEPLFWLDAHAVYQCDVWIVHDIADQPVVDIKTVLEILGIEHGIADLLPHFGFDSLYDRSYPVQVELIADDQQVDPGIPMLYENAGSHHELDPTGRRKASGQSFIGMNGSGREEHTQRIEIRELFI